MIRAAQFALTAVALLSAPARAGVFADLGEIDQAIAAYTGAPLGEPGGAAAPVDRRLHLARCAAPLALYWYNARRETLVVKCPEGTGWHLFVPISIAAGSATAPSAAPAAIAVARGEAVTISVEGEGFSVAQPGEALEAGAVGEWIRVRGLREGLSKGEAMRARIVRPGLVAVPLP